MKATDLIKVIEHESLMTLLFTKKDGTIRKVVASRCKMMYEKVTADSGKVWAHKGSPAGTFPYIDVAENCWKSLIVSNLIAVKKSDGTIFCRSKKALKAAEKAMGEKF